MSSDNSDNARLRLAPLKTLLSWIVLCSCCSALADETADFARDIQPILARRCFACHGPSEHESGLSLHRRDTATSPADSGRIALVPGRPQDSELLRRVMSMDPEVRMPPDGPRLDKRAIQNLRSWITEGAVFAGHWAWSPSKRPTVPVVKNTDWPLNPIDNFILARLEREGCNPSRPADPFTLLRRVHLDLIGLPPTPEQIADFVRRLTGDSTSSISTTVIAEVSPQHLDSVYATTVDRLLASPHFGERWGRHWLDLARYADSFGYERDDVRPNAWRYRDWVIDAINRDLPHAEFAIRQLAGDLLPGTPLDGQLAAGLHRMNIKNNESGINKEDYRNREIVDRVNTTATAFLGITIGCSQCHDHKYDPFTQSDFYRLYGLFNNTIPEDVDIPGTSAEQAAYQRALSDVEQHERDLKQAHSLLEDIRKAGGIDTFLTDKNSPDEVANILTVLACDPSVQSAIRTRVGQRTAAESRQVAAFNHALGGRIDDNNKAQRQLSVEKRHLPKPYVMTLKEVHDKRRPTHVLIRGDFKQTGTRVAPGIPNVLGSLQPRNNHQEADRLDLANWIAAPDNPLSKRVAVNRIWQHLFGAALVRTVDDFGMQGSPPTHPGLLNWLADEFARCGGSRKSLVRTIVLSQTYRQASHHRPDLQAVDPENELIARQGRFRVESELVRDLALAASGLIYQKLGGPTIHPPVSSAIHDLAYKYKTRWIVSEPPQRYARGIYVHFKRTNPFPSLIMFDSPESNVCTAVRNRSNTPLQALTTLNDPVFVEAAQAFARRILSHAHTHTARLQRASLIALARSLSATERLALEQLQTDEYAYFRQHTNAAAALVGHQPHPGVSTAELASWISVARALINLDEFITRE